jgi:chromosome transmission fidelity protein 18
MNALSLCLSVFLSLCRVVLFSLLKFIFLPSLLSSFFQVREISEWNVFNDLLTHHINSQQQYALFPYLAFVPAAYHHLFAGIDRPYLKFPKIFFESHQAEEKNSRVILEMMEEASPAVRRVMDLRTFALDIVSPLLNSISVAFRPVAFSLFSDSEKLSLGNVVDTMIAYNLTFKQNKIALTGMHYDFYS